jgi:1-acyl-sn-glycerol-3-phosphate acyltransferase
MNTGADASSRLLRVVAAMADELRADGATGGRVQLDSQFERELGFDSLARAELLERIEQVFAVRLPVDAFASAVTPGDVLRALAAASPRLVLCGDPHDAPFTSTGDIQLPRDARTLAEALQWHADRHPERTHIRLLPDGLEETPLSFGELYRQATEAAGGLRALGIDPGNTIALMLPTGCDYFIAFMASLLCGAVPVPIYPPTRRSHLAEHVKRHTAILANAQVKMLIAFDEVAAIARLLRTRVSTLQHVLTLNQIVRRPLGALVEPQPEGIALLQYTSGSTGAPKGVVLSHANLLANIRAMGERMQVSGADVPVSWLPLYHDMGLIGAWLAPLYFGLPLVITSPLTFLARPERWLRMIARYRGTITAAPNFAYERCARHLADADLEGLDLSSIRFAFCGAEPVNPGTLRAFSARFAPYGFEERALTPVYGLAENSLAVTFPSPGGGLQTDRVSRKRLNTTGEATHASTDDDAIEVSCCGYPLRGTQLRIVDAREHELPERAVGRVEFRGTSATRGYYRNTVQTALLFRSEWLDSGDLGYIADGQLFITGRVKDMIIRGGQHFFPYELESAIGRLPGIVPAGVAVCGGTSAASGTERLVIFAESRETDVATRNQLSARINAATIALFGAPAEQVNLVAPHSILKTTSGKIRHAATLERFERHGQRLPVAPARWRQLFDVAAGSIAPLLRRAMRRSRDVTWGVYCWSLVALLAPILWCGVVFHRDMERNWRVTAHACRTLLRLAGLRVQLAGTPGAFPSEPVIVTANHTSYLDNVVLMSALARPLSFVAKRELSAWPFVGRFLRAIGVHFVERRDYCRSLEDEAGLVAQAARSDTLLFFPEGTFTRSAGLDSFHLGAFRVACLAQRPVVPIALHGAPAVLRDGEWLPRRGGITVTVLPPIRPDGNDFRAMTQLRDRVRRAILAHCGEPELQTYAD